MRHLPQTSRAVLAMLPLGMNQVLRQRVSTSIEFHSCTPDELIGLTLLMGREGDDVIDGDAVQVLRPAYAKYYAEEKLTEAAI